MMSAIELGLEISGFALVGSYRMMIRVCSAGAETRP
jgi:hypothetical protein